jgi:3-deoxy-manno-octulosonate cytidylyltransferase (CMP-KDO synthetase)
MKILGVIPARYASSRFPGKPLIDLGGKSMIQRVYEQAKKAESLSRVIVATDDERIYNHVESFGGEVMMTNEHHQSGTDRCAEVLSFVNTTLFLNDLDTNKDNVQYYGHNPKRERTTFDAVVNIQGDEPFINPVQINQVAEILRGGDFSIATLAKSLDNQSFIHDPNIVKVVFSGNGQALYFSRSPIPYLRNTPQSEWHLTGSFYKHIGLYAYKSSVLQSIAQLKPSPLELTESLEQLRWLEAQFSIGVGITELETIGIDTPEDIKKVKHLFS